MQRSKFTAALLAMALGVSAVGAAAQPRDRDDGRDGRHGRQEQRHDGRHDDRRGPGRHDDRDHGRPSYNPHRGPPPHAHGGPPPRHWQRGERLPPSYRARTYVIDDWRGHHLRQPPRGHRWVQVGADYVLIAIATGLIAQVILSQ